MNEIFSLIFIISTIISNISCENILGCGGFVKSHVPIDFSRVEVKLLTKHGILKDKINCAPNNGYYFVPLYDKGEYILELEPPPGWSFTPTKVEITVDGVSDLCSTGKDINFIFKGFGITGTVESLGLKSGPEGVEIELKSSGEVRKTLTRSNGEFFFTPVYPGKYAVKISTSKWKIFKNSINVVVAEGNTELPSGSLIIQGYDVSGRIENEKEPIKDVIVLIFSSDNRDDVKVDGCRRDLDSLRDNIKYLCYVKTNSDGIFKFPTVPPGKYFVAPFFLNQNIHYQPNSIQFTVEHGSVVLQEKFEIIGFSAIGRVCKDLKNTPLPNARIFLNDKEITETDNNGYYKLEKLKAGLYKLTSEYDGILFNEIVLKITPNTKLPTLTPNSYRICGNIVSDNVQTITFSKIGSTRIISTKSDPKIGKFCEYLNPGKYQIEVVVNDEDLQKGHQFYPKTHIIEVISNRDDIMTFSQLKATLHGRVQCINEDDCKYLDVILHPFDEPTITDDISISIIDNTYKIDDIYPGKYEITLSSNKLCWNTEKHIVNVNSIDVEVSAFIQTGYSVVFISSHNTQIKYKLPGRTVIETVEIPKGYSSHCVEKSGDYSFELDSCHSYDTNIINYNTNDEINEIFLNAQKHRTTLLIESAKKLGDVTAIVNIDGIKTQLGPLPYKNNYYEINLLLNPNDNAIIIPNSDLLYFEPQILKINGDTDCINLGVKFQALPGIVYKGKIIPPLANVTITVEIDNNDSLMAETDQNGTYKFPPLDKTKTYKLTAKKDSYVLFGPDNDGNFLARKLAEIIIEVVDNNNTPLEGTLLSLSGAESYRSNLQTNREGKITFHSLSPGEYFLRPMMKEYSFEPTSRIISVKEGETVLQKLLGKRVAYSAYGYVTSLNGEPEDNIIIMAQGVGNCSHFSEEATSELNGAFRIRALQPYCSYDIKVKGSLNDKVKIERSVPKTIRIDKVVGDVNNLKLIVFRPLTNVDILVKINAKSPEHYKSLRIKIVRETPPVTTVYTGRVDASTIPSSNDYNYGVMVHLPSVPFDGKLYSIHLESSQHNRLEPEPQFITANKSFKYVEFDFMVKTNINEQEIKQTSIWALIFIFIMMFIVYNIDTITQLIKNQFGNYNFNIFNKKTSGNNDYQIDNDDIDKIVESIVSVKRKPKSKKL